MPARVDPTNGITLMSEQPLRVKRQSFAVSSSLPAEQPDANMSNALQFGKSSEVMHARGITVGGTDASFSRKPPPTNASMAPGKQAGRSRTFSSATSSSGSRSDSPDGNLSQQKDRRVSNVVDLRGLRGSAYTPLRILQASPFMHWLDGDEDFRSLARFFSVHHFYEGDALPESPFYLVATGLINVHTDTGQHQPATHGRGSFFLSANIQLKIGKGTASRALWCCASASYDDGSESEEEDDDEEPNAMDASRTFGPGRTASAVNLAEQSVPRIAASQAALEKQRRDSAATPPTAESMPRRQSLAKPGPGTEGRSSSIVGPLHIPKIRTRATTRVHAITEGDCLIMSDLAKVRKLLRASPACQQAVQNVAQLEAMLLQLPLFYQSHLNSSARLQLRDLVSYTAVEAGSRIQSSSDDGEVRALIRGSAPSFQRPSRTHAVSCRRHARGGVLRLPASFNIISPCMSVVARHFTSS